MAARKSKARKASSPEEFGALLRQFRDDAGLSQNALARAAAIDPTSLNRIEKGRSGRPRLSTINRLCRALGWGPSHEKALQLRVSAGYNRLEREAVTSTDELRRMLMESVSEFNRWREIHDDDTRRLDWTGQQFPSAMLRTADFHHMTLAATNFENADLVRANLRGADLSKANLRLADMRGANLREADLTEADLSGADLRGAYLQSARLNRAILNNSDFRGADLRGSDLSDAIVRKADFRRADLSGANLTGAILVDTNLIKADLLDATLVKTDLRRAQFRDRELRSEADLRHAKLLRPVARTSDEPAQASRDAYEDPDRWNGE